MVYTLFVTKIFGGRKVMKKLISIFSIIMAAYGKVYATTAVASMGRDRISMIISDEDDAPRSTQGNISNGIDSVLIRLFKSFNDFNAITGVVIA